MLLAECSKFIDIISCSFHVVVKLQLEVIVFTAELRSWRDQFVLDEMSRRDRHSAVDTDMA